MKLKSNLIFIIGIGVIFIIVGIVAMHQGNSLKRRCTEQTIGTVVENICHEDSTYTRPTYFPVIEYQAGDRTISQMSKSGEYPSKYKEGDQVEIYYNPNNVQEYIIKGDSTSNYVGIIALVLGSIALVVSLVVGFISRKS